MTASISWIHEIDMAWGVAFHLAPAFSFDKFAFQG